MRIDDFQSFKKTQNDILNDFFCKFGLNFNFSPRINVSESLVQKKNKEKFQIF